VNRIAKSGDLQSSALQSMSSRRETHVSRMDEIIAALDRYFYSPEHNFDWKHAEVLEYSSAREIPGQWRRRSSAGISSGAKDECCRACFPRFAAQTLATTVTRPGAVSSVVERLVYTERVGGSKPSPPILHFRFSVGKPGRCVASVAGDLRHRNSSRARDECRSWITYASI
jgi:hypothetical protein